MRATEVDLRILGVRPEVWAVYGLRQLFGNVEGILQAVARPT